MSKKNESINAIISNIEKQMGNREGPIIMRYGDVQKSQVDVEAISYGFKEIDEASNCNGIPRGKLIEIFGPESGGKSLLSLRVIASAQKQSLNCCLIDAEQSFDPKWSAQQGVDIKNLFIMNEPLCAETTLDYVVKICQSGGFGLVVIDSTAALVPRKELEGSMSDQDVALLARVMSKACRALINACAATKTTCIFINQLRDKMGGMAFGDNTTTPGGRALKFFSSQRVRVVPGSKILVKEGTENRIVGRKSYVTFVKNKVATPFGEAEISIIFNAKSLNPVMMLANLARNLKIVRTYKGEYKLDKVATGCYNMEDLADYLVTQNKVLEVLTEAEKYIVENPYDKDMKEIEIDEAILEMKSHPELIVSPKTINLDINAALISSGRELTAEEKKEEDE